MKYRTLWPLCPDVPGSRPWNACFLQEKVAWKAGGGAYLVSLFRTLEEAPSQKDLLSLETAVLPGRWAQLGPERPAVVSDPPELPCEVDPGWRSREPLWGFSQGGLKDWRTHLQRLGWVPGPADWLESFAGIWRLSSVKAQVSQEEIQLWVNGETERLPSELAKAMRGGQGDSALETRLERPLKTWLFPVL